MGILLVVEFFVQEKNSSSDVSRNFDVSIWYFDLEEEIDVSILTSGEKIIRV